jgi:hypothetical protein
MNQKVRNRRGPRYRPALESPAELSADVREFRAHTEGLSNRLAYPSLEAQRAGAVTCLHTHLRRYLLSARKIGLTREWAMRLVVWLQRTVDSLWPQSNTPTRVLEERAMQVEHADNCQEKKLDLEKSICEKQGRIDTLSAEVAADMVLLARYQREVETAEQGAV